MIKFYNTLHREIKEFSPNINAQVNLYTCGPTVYDYQHIGNFRKFVFDDTLRRTLELSNLNVHHVMNITDVGHLVSDADEGEDKLEKGAIREGKSVQEIAEYYTEVFKQDAKKLNILPPNAYQGQKDNYARATDFINEQVELIKLLLEKGFAYQTEQAIYFDVTKLSSYGELTGQKLSDKEVAARAEVVTDTNKHHPQDFSVWFFLVGHFANHSMHWESPWGKGFPGWHLECSAIIHSTLGEPLDIHTGGIDHIGTHHTNEMAQSEAAYGRKLSNFWLHSEHLLVDSKKMSKSLGNYYRLDDIIEKGYDPLALRLLFLQGHYRTQINFTWENLEAAQNRLREMQAFADLRFQFNPDASLLGIDYFNTQKTSILNALKDDLSTPEALKIISEITNWTEKAGGINASAHAEEFTDFISFIDRLTGLNLSQSKDISEDQKEMLIGREEARKSQDWQSSDELRKKLAEQKIEVKDTPHGPIWFRA